jgi:isopentenyl-diphosphate delta-isomerase type 1
MDKKVEYLDILDEKGEKTGMKDTYNNVHSLGLIHRTAHVWFINSKNQILVQKRAKNKVSHPGLWDISAAGHISAGQTSIEGAIREIEEEVGIKFPESAFKYLFTIQSNSTEHNGTFINNEFQDVYIIRTNTPVSEMKLQKEEVDEVRWLDIEEFKKWINGEGEKMVSHNDEYTKLLQYLNL